jgi:nucleoid-associated protein YgaU
MGIVVGTTLGLRSGSLFPGQATAGAGARPTIVIGSAPSPSPAVALASSPSPVGSPIAQAPSASVERTQEYVVEAGDTMRSIAQQVYGDPELWPRIYDANRDVIGPDPDNLQVGMRLKIPPS